MWHTGVAACNGGRSGQVSVTDDVDCVDCAEVAEAMKPVAGGLQLNRLAPAAERKTTLVGEDHRFWDLCSAMPDRAWVAWASQYV